MQKYLKILMYCAALLGCAVLCSCGNKSDVELALDGEAVDGPAYEEAYGDGLTQEGNSGEETMGEQGDGGVTDAASVVSKEDQTQAMTVFVHICGAVRTPDVYEVPRDARIIDVIKLAGGFTDEADSDYHNLAGTVADGQKIYVPTEQEVTDGLVPPPELNTVAVTETGEVSDAANAGSTGEEGDKVNINTATVEELKTLNGIGDKRAQDIIDYRNSNGNFKNIEDIKKVNGIKDGVYSKICDDITV